MSIFVEDLSKEYGHQKALDQVSFSLSSGEIVGLLGPNGAGKTTTMKILAGFISDYEGTAQIAGMDVTQHPLLVKEKIGYLPEHNPLYTEMYVREYLSFIGSIHGISHLQSRIEEMIEIVGLTKEQGKKIASLSKGYRQRVGLAQALIHDPEVLILDEPTSGLDPNQLVEIRQLIRSIGSKKTVMFSSHILQEVQAICDRVLVLNRGKIVADQSISEFENRNNQERIIFVELNDELEKPWQLPELQKQHQDQRRYYLHFSKTGPDPRPHIFDYVVEQERKILHMEEVRSTVEDVFQKLTAN